MTTEPTDASDDYCGGDPVTPPARGPDLERAQ
ncbi:hypothetical protein FWK35_00012294 [Aphis craccivora]|uniref:Uncharacterized protein n=1 Tax=Aphis craccivora TaxID=307492 RepID=A0A6G0Z4A6_APHCR|nr:hypothetical protein FWK35_00012294 [Aphis craccivora]